MTVTPKTFRENFPEFKDIDQYTDSGIQYYVNVATNLSGTGRGMFRASLWKSALDTGVELFVAHNMVLEARAQAEANNGAVPGVSTGAISDKSVDKVRVGYDTAGSAEEGAGHWNLTVYGTRLKRLINMFGMGPITIGGGCSPSFNGPAWPGPYIGGGSGY